MSVIVSHHFRKSRSCLLTTPFPIRLTHITHAIRPRNIFIMFTWFSQIFRTNFWHNSYTSEWFRLLELFECEILKDNYSSHLIEFQTYCNTIHIRIDITFQYVIQIFRFLDTIIPTTSLWVRRRQPTAREPHVDLLILS